MQFFLTFLSQRVGKAMGFAMDTLWHWTNHFLYNNGHDPSSCHNWKTYIKLEAAVFLDGRMIILIQKYCLLGSSEYMSIGV